MCGEMIVKTAAKCRYCGEVFQGKSKSKKKSKSSRSSATDELSVVDWLLCIFCGGIGCIVGVVAMCTGSPSRGGKMIGISVAMGVFWRILITAIQMAIQAGN